MGGKSKSDRKTIRYIDGMPYKEFTEKMAEDHRGLSAAKIIEVCANKGAEFYSDPKHKGLFFSDLMK